MSNINEIIYYLIYENALNDRIRAGDLSANDLRKVEIYNASAGKTVDPLATAQSGNVRNNITNLQNIRTQNKDLKNQYSNLKTDLDNNIKSVGFTPFQDFAVVDNAQQDALSQMKQRKEAALAGRQSIQPTPSSNSSTSSDINDMVSNSFNNNWFWDGTNKSLADPVSSPIVPSTPTTVTPTQATPSTPTTVTPTQATPSTPTTPTGQVTATPSTQATPSTPSTQATPSTPSTPSTPTQATATPTGQSSSSTPNQSDLENKMLNNRIEIDKMGWKSNPWLYGAARALSGAAGGVGAGIGGLAGLLGLILGKKGLATAGLLGAVGGGSHLMNTAGAIANHNQNISNLNNNYNQMNQQASQLGPDIQNQIHQSIQSTIDARHPYRTAFRNYSNKVGTALVNSGAVF